MLEKCIQLDRDCATICWTASQFMVRDSEMSRKSATYVLNYVRHALENAKSISIWNIANYVRKHVEDVQRNVAK